MRLTVEGFGEVALEVPAEGICEGVFFALGVLFAFGVDDPNRKLLAFSLSLAAKIATNKYRVSI